MNPKKGLAKPAPPTKTGNRARPKNRAKKPRQKTAPAKSWKARVFDRKLLGQRLRELRHARALSSRAFEDLTGIRHSTICEIERGAKGMSDKMLAIVAKFYSVSIDGLFADCLDPHDIRP